MEAHRTFDSGATRDLATGKLEYKDYINPLCDYSFANYMKSKQIIGGEYRRGDNWQKGIPQESLMDSLTRHMEIVKLLYKGYRVFETKTNGVVDLIVLKMDSILDEKSFDFCEEKTIVNELNAIRFNSEALKLSFLAYQYIN